MAVVRGGDIHEITGGQELPELHLTQVEIAAIKLSYLELVAKVSINPVSGLEETGLDRVTRKAFKIDPEMTKMLFGVEATRKLEVDPRTGLRKKRTANTMNDDLAFIDASLSSAVASGAQNRARTLPPPMRDPPADAVPKLAPSPGDVAPKAVAKKAPKRAASRPKRAASKQKESSYTVDARVAMLQASQRSHVDTQAMGSTTTSLEAANSTTTSSFGAGGSTRTCSRTGCTQACSGAGSYCGLKCERLADFGIVSM